MIFLYTGKPGSGKTYKAVYDLLYVYQKQFFILHNIDGLKSESFDRPELVCNFLEKYVEFGTVTVDQFFTKQFQNDVTEAIKEKYQKPVLLVVDECSDYFLGSNPAYLEWLKYHRHFGQSILFVTQDEKMLHFTFRRLVNHEIRAKVDLKIAFIYQKIVGGSGVAFVPVLKKKKVFNSYKSFEIESVKHKSKLLLFFAIFVIYAGYNFVTKPRKAFKTKHPEMVESVASARASIPQVDLSNKYSLHPQISQEFYYSGCVERLNKWKDIFVLDTKRSKFFIEKDSQTFTFKVFFPDYSYYSHDSESLTITNLDNQKIIFLKHEKEIPPAGSRSRDEDRIRPVGLTHE